MPGRAPGRPRGGLAALGGSAACRPPSPPPARDPIREGIPGALIPGIGDHRPGSRCLLRCASRPACFAERPGRLASAGPSHGSGPEQEAAVASHRIPPPLRWHGGACGRRATVTGVAAAAPMPGAPSARPVRRRLKRGANATSGRPGTVRGGVSGAASGRRSRPGAGGAGRAARRAVPCDKTRHRRRPVPKCGEKSEAEPGACERPRPHFTCKAAQRPGLRAPATLRRQKVGKVRSPRAGA